MPIMLTYNTSYSLSLPPYRQPSAPPYLYRQNFIPYQQSDFGDGGAYPEVHVVQYPLDMGRPGAKSSAVISVDVDESGEVRYDAIVKHGGNQKKIIQTSLDDMKEKKGATYYY
jgi:SNW domain-containing protein 1